MKVFVGTDHRGFRLKAALMAAHPHLKWVDVGCTSTDRCDYPVFAAAVAQPVSEGLGRGVLICNSGVGMAIAANRSPGVYAALCHTTEQVIAARQHNNANILVLAANELSDNQAGQLLLAFLETPFLGGRYADRLAMIDKK